MKIMENVMTQLKYKVLKELNSEEYDFNWQRQDRPRGTGDYAR
jgi:hypothetical protein